MNWLLLVILAMIVGNVLWGYRLGFMRVAVSLVSWIVVMLSCYILTPVVADVILEVTPISEIVQETVTEKINDALDEVADGVVDSEALEKVEEELPDQVLDSILGKHDSLEDLVTSKGEIEVDTSELAYGAAYLIGLILVLIVTRIALIIVDKVLGLASKLPLIGQADTLLGLFAGALKGLIWGWVALTVIAMLAYTGSNTDLIVLVNDSEILTWLYENNPIMLALSEVL